MQLKKVKEEDEDEEEELLADLLVAIARVFKGRRKRPSGVLGFTLVLEADMSNVRLLWKNSVPSNRQRPIAATRIDARVHDDLSWGEVNTRPVPATELLIENITAGTWQFRATEIDDAGVESTNNPVIIVDIPFAAPSGIAAADFTHVIE